MLIPFSSWAQSITGTVVDSDGQSIAFANVALCQSKDSTIIAGCTSDENGKFYFTTESTEGMYLRISFVGYKTKLVELGVSPLRVTLESIMLNEVTVVARRKLYEQKNGEMIANVKGTILETFPKTADVIAQLPFVSSQNGVFTVFGKVTPVVYINNRLVKDLKELDQLMPSEIKKIKVNTMPGEKYDATVGAVIQIITEKVQGEGLSWTLYAGSKRSERWSAEEFASLNYRHKVWDVFGSAYLIQKHQQIKMKANQQLSVADAVHEVGYDEKEKVKSNRIAAVGGINYNPNEKISAGVQYVFNHSTWKNDMLNNISHVVNNEMEEEQQLALSNKPDHTHNINAYFSGDLGSGLSLDFNFDWLKGNESDNMYSWFPNDASEDVNTVSNRQYGYYASKGILTYANKYVNIEGGGEYSYTDMTQTYDIDNTTLGINNSNDVTKQNRWALFVSAKSQFGNWGFGAGIRYEDIDFDYYKNNDSRYAQLTIQYNFNATRSKYKGDSSSDEKQRL
ncbi:MAG: carboxypeptidase-like regulatory domain-containing protein [Prevotella sp.]|nr:carboxypeptidase-like regulatory domain-containing protein [Prevotella sp.]